LISGSGSTSNNYAHGYYCFGKDIIENVLNRIRQVAHDCDNLHGIIVFNSNGGGIGSGLSSLLVERLSVEYGRKFKIQVAVVPSAQFSSSVVEPYNAVLATHLGLEHFDSSILVDNEAMYKFSQIRLNVKSPELVNFNRLVAQVVSSVTASHRFNGTQHVDFTDLHTNIVPYPRIHFLMALYSPLTATSQGPFGQQNVINLVRDCFHPSSQLLTVDSRPAKYISCSTLFRGNGVAPVHVSNALNVIKDLRSTVFVDYNPTGFKVGINDQPPIVVSGEHLTKVPRALCMLSSTTAIAQVWERLVEKFDVMYSRNEFVQGYLSEGMEQGDFLEAREDVGALLADYEEVGCDSIIENDDEIAC